MSDQTAQRNSEVRTGRSNPAYENKMLQAEEKKGIVLGQGKTPPNPPPPPLRERPAAPAPKQN
jgi:hypothetical protein